MTDMLFITMNRVCIPFTLKYFFFINDDCPLNLD